MQRNGSQACLSDNNNGNTSCFLIRNYSLTVQLVLLELHFSPWPLGWDKSVVSVLLIFNYNGNISHFLIRKLSAFIE